MSSYEWRKTIFSLYLFPLPIVVFHYPLYFPSNFPRISAKLFQHEWTYWKYDKFLIIDDFRYFELQISWNEIQFKFKIQLRQNFGTEDVHLSYIFLVADWYLEVNHNQNIKLSERLHNYFIFILLTPVNQSTNIKLLKSLLFRYLPRQP